MQDDWQDIQELQEAGLGETEKYGSVSGVKRDATQLKTVSRDLSLSL